MNERGSHNFHHRRRPRIRVLRKDGEDRRGRPLPSPRPAPRTPLRRRRPPAPPRREASASQREDRIPPLPEGAIRIVPLGGVEEIGRNMTVFEYRNDIIVVDCGFQFKEEDTPGIDYILPNTKYLEDRREKIRAVVITHGHLDHIGAIPYVMESIGNPPIYSRLLTTTMIKKRQEEFPHLPPLDIRVVEKEDRIAFGDLAMRFFAVKHSIPDSMGVILETPDGVVVHTGDLKVEHEDGVPTPREEETYGIFAKEKVIALLSDSTNVENPGFSIPDSTVHRHIEEIVKTMKGRLIIGTFASQLERIIKIFEICEKYGKKVVVEGRSMKTNVEIAKHLKLLTVKRDTIIPVEEMDSYPPERIVTLATGAQGDEFSALMRMATKSHKFFKITKRDTVLLSSSIIPGNERAVQKLKDNLSRQGAHIIHNKVMDIHSSGHANRDETMWIHRKINPRFFIPIHGYHYMLRVHADIEAERGTPEENIVIPDNGSIIEIREKGTKIVHLRERAPSSIRMVDGFAIGDIQEVVIRDRKALAEDGMFVIIATVHFKTGKLKKSPDIISRGFVYLRESQELLQQTRLIIKKTIEKAAAGMNPINFEYLKGVLTDEVSRFLFEKTNKRPIVIPVLLGV